MSHLKKNIEKSLYNKKFGIKKKAWQKVNEEVAVIDEKLANFDQTNAKTFSDYPLSQKSLKGLSSCKFLVPTAIQMKTLVPSLRGEDIVGAAKTGSGKTLAFIIPILEKLYKLRWSKLDGVGALVVTPTRELATQIFKVFNSVGKFHDFSVGLVTGGKSMKEEERVISCTNIILATPGRILHHLDKTYCFTLDNLQILVLDEADRMLDEGFKTELNHIIEHLPSHKQTLLYSATQTKLVEDIGRLKMKDWLFVSAEASTHTVVPELLRQHYVFSELEGKFNFLWTFLTRHRKKKAIVFVSTCKQARFMHELVQKMQPGVTMLCLHGAMSHKKRLQMCNAFNNKKYAYLIATDVAARGLDFRGVDSVMQYDAPEDVKTYVHRVGRTARYNKDGDGWLLLLPSEDKLLQHLSNNRIKLQLQKVRADKLQDVSNRVRHFVFTDKVMTDYAKKAFSTYMKSVYMRADKEVFDVTRLNFNAFARSLGLQDVPKVRFIHKQERMKEINKRKKNERFISDKNEEEEKEDDDDEDDDDDDEDDDDDDDDDDDKDYVRGGVGAEDEEEENEEKEDESNDDDDDDADAERNVTSGGKGGKKRDLGKELEEVRERLKRKMNEQSVPEVTQVAPSVKNLKKSSKALMNKKIVFEDHDKANKKRRLQELIEEMKEQDEEDKQVEKLKRKKERQLKKEKMKKKNKEQDDKEEAIVTLAEKDGADKEKEEEEEEEEEVEEEEEEEEENDNGDSNAEEALNTNLKKKKSSPDDSDDEDIDFSAYKDRLAQNEDDESDNEENENYDEKDDEDEND